MPEPGPVFNPGFARVSMVSGGPGPATVRGGGIDRGGGAVAGGREPRRPQR